MARLRPPQILTEIPPEAISFDALAFDTMIRSQGVQLDHYIAQRCPVGMTDLDDNRRPHADHANCSNGFLYKKVGTVSCLLTSNQKTSQNNDTGIMDHSTFQMTAPRFYDDPEDKQVSIAPFDRFFLHEENVVVVYWQLFLAHQTGQNRLNFPIVEVIRLIDSQGREFQPGCDFDIVNGQLVFKGQNRPGIDPDARTSDLQPKAADGTSSTGVGIISGTQSRGIVCSIRYTYRPYVYVGPVLHDVRVTMGVDQQTGEQKIIRMPQAAVVHREFVFLNEKHDHEAQDSTSARQTYGPQEGSFGPR